MKPRSIQLTTWPHQAQHKHIAKTYHCQFIIWASRHYAMPSPLYEDIFSSSYVRILRCLIIGFITFPFHVWVATLKIQSVISGITWTSTRARRIIYYKGFCMQPSSGGRSRTLTIKVRMVAYTGLWGLWGYCGTSDNPISEVENSHNSKKILRFKVRSALNTGLKIRSHLSFEVIVIYVYGYWQDDP